MVLASTRRGTAGILGYIPVQLRGPLWLREENELVYTFFTTGRGDIVRLPALAWTLDPRTLSCSHRHIRFVLVKPRRIFDLIVTSNEFGPHLSHSVPEAMFRTLSNIIPSIIARSLSAPSLARSVSTTGERVLAIALGSNLGDKVRNIETALRILETQHGIRVVDTSFLYESSPMYFKDQPPFVNGACLVNISLATLKMCF